MTDADTDGMTSAVSAPIIIMPGEMFEYVHATFAPDIHQNPMEASSKPPAVVSLAPTKWFKPEDIGATMANAAAIGSMRNPACRAG